MREENFDQNFTWHEWTFVAPDESTDDRAPDFWTAARDADRPDARMPSELTVFFD